jgi:pimeloyl-ACP methyl ester carboxylesterase
MSKRSPWGSRWWFDRWGFHDYVIHDAPAAVAYVLETTGASGLHWVGHSMGGMIGICARSQGMEGLKSIIALGSPSFEKENRFTSGGALAVGGFFLRWIPVLPTRLFFFLIWPLLALWGPPSRIYCRSNLGRRELGGLIAGAYDDLSGGELRDLLSFRSAGRLTPYADRYDRVGLPVLSIIGNEDRVVSPEDAEMFAHLLPGSVGCRILGECGHADLIVGRQAPETVFVRIAGFLGDVECKKLVEV